MFLLRNTISTLSYTALIALLAILGGCGSGGESTVDTDDGSVSATGAGDKNNDDTDNTDNTDSNSDSGNSSEISIHLVLQVRSTDASSSGFSNEVSFTASPGETVNMSWSDPTRRVNDECLSQTSISEYSLRYGSDPNSYSIHNAISKMDDRGLICQPTASTDGACGSVYKCEYSFDVSADIAA